MTVFTRLKMVVLAPMAMAKVTVAASTSLDWRRSARNALANKWRLPRNQHIPYPARLPGARQGGAEGPPSEKYSNRERRSPGRGSQPGGAPRSSLADRFVEAVTI